MMITRKTLLFLLSLGILCGCDQKRETTQTLPPPHIEVELPVQRTVVYTFEYPGYLEAEQTVTLVARVSGYLESFHFKPGQRVQAGQLLFVIEPQPYKDKVLQAEAALESSKSQLAYAKANYEKMRGAMHNSAVSEIDFLQAESNYGEARAAYEEARSQLDMANINLNYCYIHAPFSGRISRNQVDPNNLVGAGSSNTTLATLYKDNQMYLYFNMGYADFLQLPARSAERTPLQITIQDVNQPEKTWVALLDYVAPNVDLSTGTISLRAAAKNPNGELVSGQYVKAIVPYKTVPKAILVPESSIGSNQGGRYLYVIGQDSTVQFRHVDVGTLTPDGMREITRGLSTSDRYVVEALVNLRPGMKVIPILKPF